MVAPADIRRRFLLPAWLAAWGMLAVVALAAGAQPLGISAGWDGAGRVRVALVPQPPMHLAAGFEVRLADGTVLEAESLPEPDLPGEFPAYGEAIEITYSVPDGVPPPEAVFVTSQLCGDDLCLMPETRSVSIGGGEAVADVPATAAGEVPPALGRFRVAAAWDGHATPERFVEFLEEGRGDGTARPGGFLSDPAGYLRAHGWGLTVLAILLGGILLNLTPCVLPVIPVNLAIIGAAASSGAPRRVRFALGLAYGAGMAAAYGGLGAAVVRAGGVFGAGLNASPWFAAAMAVLFAALGVAMLGAWNLDFSRWRRASRVAGRARFPAAFLAGGLSALLAGACVAPVLVAVLALAGGLYSAGQARALLLPFLLGVGMALPWPLAAAGIAVLPKPGAWMERVKKVFGVLILALAVWYAWSAAARFAASRTGGDGRRTPPGFVSLDLASPDAAARLDVLLAEAADADHPVLLDFGARWCKVCAMMDATTLRDGKVSAALDGVLPVAILADDPASSAAAPLLARCGVRGYPAYRFLRPAPPAGE